MKKDFLSILDMESDELEGIIADAIRLKGEEPRDDL